MSTTASVWLKCFLRSYLSRISHTHRRMFTRITHAIHSKNVKVGVQGALGETFVCPLKAFTDHSKRVRREDPRIYQVSQCGFQPPTRSVDRSTLPRGNHTRYELEALYPLPHVSAHRSTLFHLPTCLRGGPRVRCCSTRPLATWRRCCVLIGEGSSFIPCGIHLCPLGPEEMRKDYRRSSISRCCIDTSVIGGNQYRFLLTLLYSSKEKIVRKFLGHTKSRTRSLIKTNIARN